MKSKEILKLIFVNPFEKIAGWQALGLGLIITVLSTLIGSYNYSYFDGFLDMHTSNPLPIWMAFAMLGINLVCVIFMFLLAGLFFSKNFRVVDVVGTSFLARAPFLFLAFVTFIPMPEILKDPVALLERVDILLSSYTFWISSILSLLIAVWFIALHYNAFKVSLNIKKNLRVVVFVFAIIFAEILSKILIKIINL
jgi:hypothetical protein